MYTVWIHHRHYILLTFDYMLYSVHYNMRKSPLYVGPGSLYYEDFHYLMSKHIYIMVDLHYMVSKHLYIKVD